jgi:hypothetical protein
MKHTIIIQLDSEKAAIYLKEQIENMNPLLEGSVKIHKEPVIQRLSEIIEDMKR